MSVLDFHAIQIRSWFCSVFLGFSVIRHKKQHSGNSMDNTFVHLWTLVMYSNDFGVDVFGDFMDFQ